MCVLSSEYLLIYTAQNRLKIKRGSWWVEFNIFRAILTKFFLKEQYNKQTLLFNIYLSKGNSVYLKTYYCLKF